MSKAKLSPSKPTQRQRVFQRSFDQQLHQQDDDEVEEQRDHDFVAGVVQGIRLRGLTLEQYVPIVDQKNGVGTPDVIPFKKAARR